MPRITRRRAPLMLAAASASFAGCAAAPGAPAAQPIEVAPGVYMVAGAAGAADTDKLGRIGNAGFIVGERGVVAIDTGTSHAHGRALLAAIRAVSDQPVRLALLTHVRPEFLFGAAAFSERGVTIRTHSRSGRMMAARCDTCLKKLRPTVGEQAMHGTTLVRPDQEFDAGHEFDLIGRPVRVLYYGHSSGPGDFAVFDVRSRVLFGGGLLDAQRVPDIQDSDLEGWKAALRELRELRPHRVVPGHGAAAPATSIATVERYLAQLEQRVRTLVSTGTSLLHVGEAGELPEFERWDQYDTIHRRNASIAYLRFERELMFK
jgi:glyoxylase-like metal-dependent hydrolase (beta-lactamase superfamily II)